LGVRSVTSDPSRRMIGSRPMAPSRGVIASAVSSVEPEGDRRLCVASGTDVGCPPVAESNLLLAPAALT